jgi:hypothetical protein
MSDTTHHAAGETFARPRLTNTPEPVNGKSLRIPERQWPSVAELALDTAFRDRQAQLSCADAALRQ